MLMPSSVSQHDAVTAAAWALSLALCVEARHASKGTPRRL